MAGELTGRQVSACGGSCCRSSSSSSCPAGSWLRPPGPSSAPAGSGHRRWAELHWCLGLPWTHHSCSGARFPIGKSSRQTALEQKRNRCFQLTYLGVLNPDSSLNVLTTDLWSLRGSKSYSSIKVEVPLGHTVTNGYRVFALVYLQQPFFFKLVLKLLKVKIEPSPVMEMLSLCSWLSGVYV